MSKMSEEMIDIMNAHESFVVTDLQRKTIEGEVDKSEPEKKTPCNHLWVTKLIFRFDMTYCSKCGEERK